MSKNLGIYIHVPFCERKCPYCDFYSVRKDDKLMQTYCDALIRRIAEAEGGCVDSIYFGGGTPSLFAQHFSPVIDAIAQKFVLAENVEITAEVNPHSSPKAVLSALRDAGVNRISIGIQSFVGEELKTLGRLHTAEEAKCTFYAAREVGFENISIDLMLAVFGQTTESLRISLDAVKELSPEHVSAYMLIIEEGTAFENKDPLDEIMQEEQYLFVCSQLENMGLKQYEISNFARDGFECKHNLKYWHDEEYLGFGPAAHSFYKGKRFYFPRDIDGFIAGSDPVPDGEGGSLEEKLMLGLRLCEGVDASLITAQTKPLIKAGLIIEKEGKISLTRQGFLLSNAVIAKLLT